MLLSPGPRRALLGAPTMVLLMGSFAMGAAFEQPIRVPLSEARNAVWPLCCAAAIPLGLAHAARAGGWLESTAAARRRVAVASVGAASGAAGIAGALALGLASVRHTTVDGAVGMTRNLLFVLGLAQMCGRVLDERVAWVPATVYVAGAWVLGSPAPARAAAGWALTVHPSAEPASWLAAGALWLTGAAAISFDGPRARLLRDRWWVGDRRWISARRWISGRWWRSASSP